MIDVTAAQRAISSAAVSKGEPSDETARVTRRWNRKRSWAVGQQAASASSLFSPCCSVVPSLCSSRTTTVSAACLTQVAPVIGEGGSAPSPSPCTDWIPAMDDAIRLNSTSRCGPTRATEGEEQEGGIDRRAGRHSPKEGEEGGGTQGNGRSRGRGRRKGWSGREEAVRLSALLNVEEDAGSEGVRS